MLNTNLKLNTKMFDADMEQVPIRKGFGEGLVIAADRDKNVIGLCADLTESTQMHFFAKKYPERFVQVGVAEQNLVTVASGMAAMGKIPFTSSYAMFSPGRNWEQIRTTICYNDRKVVIVGSHAGISVGPDGGTHQAIEDIALMRVLPNMTVISPCDAIEAKKATIAIAKTKEPTYIRLAREKTPIITSEDTPFEIGKAQVFFAPPMTPQVGIVATGALVHKAIVAAQNFAEKGISVKVLNISSIRPLDFEAIINLAKEAGAIVSVEEHQIVGGFGSAVAEVLVQNYPVPMELIGVHDKFGQSGTPDELLEHYHMGISHIEKAVEKVLGRK
ncbi:MAG: transketolase [Candidatus Zambryskibacteria bacterium RIFCSPLOWO2_01_FULL_39_39]|uniref:Transketolase n=1 Tax=Candidatus Zambryskibacteria bacterium RIFCSPLOWO2_01_FULL_39_39 TaxID=1802758 RepID=A0A1G2TZU0_9BACT|nr:MAG: transketolase [Candidatus Zambryskibacteria bacterium RIFCSPHIGHO2_01_FULL_39_63]OHA94827.1 MAG: transketolase [Candidatus Zambryskibacteria bacterium RIFCSPHIGHO2_02_FULL_39_19]OHA98317.1 MAG: transketolase [Candidatus Zambryskibacteria bacterium RIFCSPHIGHO2_12_FULL_39_21]OHB02703.1 MAG: transketolase [Candidatus Zambryskibacteria bacterium RIFCSPLOWO2_01_FULL_39_39]